MRSAARVFDLAKQDLSGYETCADQLVTTFKGNRKLLEDVLEGLLYIAKSDEALHPQEEQFLGQVAKRFGFTEIEFTYIKARHAIAAERNPYDVLGLESSVSDSRLRATTGSLWTTTNPTNLWRLVPKEFVLIATEKVKTINEAYHAIAKERGI